MLRPLLLLLWASFATSVVVKILPVLQPLTTTLPKTNPETLADCPGQSSSAGEGTCNQDKTHRVCTRLLKSDYYPLTWGTRNFWNITGQEAFLWSYQMKHNNGTSWCISMWAFAELVQDVGCDQVHLTCNATDVDFVLTHNTDFDQYTGQVFNLTNAHTCLREKCIPPTTTTSTTTRTRRAPAV